MPNDLQSADEVPELLDGWPADEPLLLERLREIAADLSIDVSSGPGGTIGPIC